MEDAQRQNGKGGFPAGPIGRLKNFFKPAIALSVLAFSGSPSFADYENRAFGSWLASAKSDRFGEGGTYFAMTSDGMRTLAVRCLEKDFSLALLEMARTGSGPKVGTIIKFKLRVDKQPVIETFGEVVAEHLIVVPDDVGAAKQILTGRELAVRTETPAGLVKTSIFQITGADRALADVLKNCPPDTATSKK